MVNAESMLYLFACWLDQWSSHPIRLYPDIFRCTYVCHIYLFACWTQQ